MTKVNIFEAKNQLSKLVRMLEDREEETIYIARNGTAIVQMTLIPKEKEGKRIGAAAGKFCVPGKFSEWDSEIEDMFGDEI